MEQISQDGDLIRREIVTLRNDINGNSNYLFIHCKKFVKLLGYPKVK